VGSAVEWEAYEVYDPGAHGLLEQLPRRDARRAYERLMASRAHRADELRRLLAANGIELGTDDTSIDALDRWFVATVQGDAAAKRLESKWYSVVNDIALFLGDAMIARSGGQLRWEFFTHGKRDLAYQRHVIVGFSGVKNPRYNVDIDYLVAAYGIEALSDRSLSGRFLLWLCSAVADA
jgi:hypothetical protein